MRREAELHDMLQTHIELQKTLLETKQDNHVDIHAPINDVVDTLCRIRDNEDTSSTLKENFVLSYQ